MGQCLCRINTIRHLLSYFQEGKPESNRAAPKKFSLSNKAAILKEMQERAGNFFTSIAPSFSDIFPF